MYIPSAWPRSTTFVSPPTIAHARRRARRAAIASTSARSVVGVEALLEDQADSVSASGFAPAIARSLTVPLTASSPIEPPGKRSGLTTNASVVSASVADARAASSSASIPKRGREQALDQRCAWPCRRRRGPS